MSLSMHAISVPVFVKMLGNMPAWLDKAQAHAEARGFDSANYLGQRLAPDMFPLASQIRIACDMVKGCVARLAGVEVPKWPDDETTLAALRQRVLNTVAYVQEFGPERFDGSATREIVLPMRSGELRMNGQDYLLQFVLPNLYFHATTTYALLRQGGVVLGKRDFLG